MLSIDRPGVSFEQRGKGTNHYLGEYETEQNGELSCYCWAVIKISDHELKSKTN